MPKYLYELPDNTQIAGDSYTEVVKSMASYKLGSVRSLKGYRSETARRSMEMYAAKIDPTTDETFVKSMVDAGLLVVVP